MKTERFLKKVHSCKLMEQALRAGFLRTNGFGCFAQNEEGYSNPLTFCPYCGKRLHKKLYAQVDLEIKPRLENYEQAINKLNKL